MDELLQQIEAARHDMHQLANLYGLISPQVVEQSIHLDSLLNKYDQMKERKSA